MVFNKKAISPVVATALLLVVAVVAVVGFQTWFNTYQSGLNTQVEQQSQTGSAIRVERLENGSVYLMNSGSTDITGVTVQVPGCTDATGETLTSGVSTVTLANCSLTTGNAVDVVVIASSGVYSSTQLVR